MPDGVSVIICCYNSAQRLPETLRHLALQQIPPGLRWEVIVVDNASSDNTASAAASAWPTSATPILRVVREAESGLSHARIRGIREAQYEILSFIDDDNWVAPDWVARVHAIFANRPEIDACGGRIETVCETEPPAWFPSIQAHYAVGRQHERSGDITDTTGTLLCGAGLTLRSSAVRALLGRGFVFLMSGRKGGQLSAGEDTELCFALRASGSRFWYDDDLILRHFIPKARLQWNYALGLMRGMGAASTLFTFYLFALDAPPFNAYPAWKKSWSFQFVKRLRVYFTLVAAHFGASTRPQEGSLPVLKIEEAKTALAVLWKWRGQYREVQEKIRQSAWAKTKPGV